MVPDGDLTGPFTLLCLDFRKVSIMNGKSKLKCCVIQVNAGQEIEMVNPKDNEGKLAGNAAVILCQAFG